MCWVASHTQTLREECLWVLSVFCVFGVSDKTLKTPGVFRVSVLAWVSSADDTQMCLRTDTERSVLGVLDDRHFQESFECTWRQTLKGVFWVCLRTDTARSLLSVCPSILCFPIWIHDFPYWKTPYQGIHDFAYWKSPYQGIHDFPYWKSLLRMYISLWCLWSMTFHIERYGMKDMDPWLSILKDTIKIYTSVWVHLSKWSCTQRRRTFSRAFVKDRTHTDVYIPWARYTHFMSYIWVAHRKWSWATQHMHISWATHT